MSKSRVLLGWELGVGSVRRGRVVLHNQNNTYMYMKDLFKTSKPINLLGLMRIICLAQSRQYAHRVSLTGSNEQAVLHTATNEHLSCALRRRMKQLRIVSHAHRVSENFEDRDEWNKAILLTMQISDINRCVC